MGQCCSQIIWSSRKEAPSHYILKIDSFSSVVSTIGKYESGVFEASGYKWKLLLYPNQVSLNLAILEDDNNLSPGWEIKAMVSFFVYDYRRSQYKTLQYRRLCRFHATKSSWGVFFPCTTFTDPYGIYLRNDRCVFGVEAFVLNNQVKGETLAVKRLEPSIPITCRWKIEKFSKLTDEFCFSDAFSFGGFEWKFKIFPKGCGESKGKSVALFLYVHNLQKLSPGWQIYLKYKMRIRNQVSGMHKEGTYCAKFSATEYPGQGIYDFLRLADLNNPYKGYAVKDTVIVEGEIYAFSQVEEFPALKMI